MRPDEIGRASDETLQCLSEETPEVAPRAAAAAAFSEAYIQPPPGQ